MPLSAHAIRRSYRLALVPALLILLGACAQQREAGYYQPAPAGTASDALHRAQGGTEVIAPSQIKLGFGADTQDKPETQAQDAAATGAPAAPTPAPAPLAATHTYLGTVPCVDGMQCPATRMTLTLAPDGQWRARSVTLDASQTVTARMGCWHITNDAPLRIMLQADGQTIGQLAFASNSILRVLSFGGQRPMLDYTLTRQADIDPINELSSRPAQDCRSVAD